MKLGSANHSYIRLISTTLVTMLLMWLISSMSANSIDMQIRQQLNNILPRTINLTLVNSFDDTIELKTSSAKVKTFLNRINTEGRIVTLIQSTSINKLRLIKGKKGLVKPKIWWPYGQSWIGVDYDLKYKINWIGISAIALMLSLILDFVCWRLPVKRCEITTKWKKKLEDNGYDSHEAKSIAKCAAANQEAANFAELLTEKSHLTFIEAFSFISEKNVLALTAKQQRWFITAISYGKPTKSALEIAKSDSNLAFNLAKNQVSIHGLTINLSKTPLLYYYWYAKRKVDGLEPYTNPAQNKPDIEEGTKLAEIMSRFDGHKKAINDLETIGIKSKTLDQNRNKIKDELTAVLGDLAAEFLFQNERDPRTARYQYSLLLPSDRIIL